MARRGIALGPGARAYRDASLPPGRTPWQAARYCAVDLELTGLDARRDEIVSFAAIPVEDGRVRLAGAVEGLVRPERTMAEESIRVHGIRPADLADAPVLDVAIDPLLAALAGSVPVAHVADVERAFLRRALRRQGLRLRRPFVDTSVLGAVWLSERDGAVPRTMALGELAETLGLPAHRPHEATGDALTTAQVFLALAVHLSASPPETVRSLVTAHRRLAASRSYPGPYDP
jgi:DNA polymerase-3 subunit epsilon